MNARLLSTLASPERGDDHGDERGDENGDEPGDERHAGMLSLSLPARLLDTADDAPTDFPSGSSGDNILSSGGNTDPSGESVESTPADDTQPLLPTISAPPAECPLGESRSIYTSCYILYSTYYTMLHTIYYILHNATYYILHTTQLYILYTAYYFRARQIPARRYRPVRVEPPSSSSSLLVTGPRRSLHLKLIDTARVETYTLNPTPATP